MVPWETKTLNTEVIHDFTNEQIANNGFVNKGKSKMQVLNFKNLH